MTIITFDVEDVTITNANSFEFNEVWHATEWNGNQIINGKKTNLYIINALMEILTGIDYYFTPLPIQTMLDLQQGKKIQALTIVGFEIK